MMLAVLVSMVELAVILFPELMKPPVFLLNIEEMLEVFGFFLMVLIGLKLLESIKANLGEDRVHAEVVFLAAIAAMARKVIIADFKDIVPEMLYGVAAVIIALASGYYLVRRALHLQPRDKGKKKDAEHLPLQVIPSQHFSKTWLRPSRGTPVTLDLPVYHRYQREKSQQKQGPRYPWRQYVADAVHGDKTGACIAIDDPRRKNANQRR